MADFKLITSSFGGGWLVPLTDDARQAYTEAFDAQPEPLVAIGGQEGWIIEPYELDDVLSDLRADSFIVLAL